MPKRKLPVSSPPEKGCAVAQTSTPENSPNKKIATEPEASTDSQKDEPPPYGTQEYWESRYAESANAGHSWYFTYDELRPLLLPLLLGRDTETFVDDDDDEGEWEEDDEEEAEIEDQAEGGNKKTSEDDGQAESESKSSDDDDDDASHISEEHPPKSVLEVGCGDVPLGHALLLDLLSMQRDTGANANLVVKEIVCNDYAKSVIDALRKRQSENWMSGGVKGSYETTEGRDGRKVERLALDKVTEEGKDPTCTDRPTLDVTYVIEDARDMAYKDESFDLIIDKGTTDALLSDKEEGISNCVKVVAEMGRCVTRGGFIMVVSHMNAHCDAGIDWCDKVLVAGLRTCTSRADASWEIEVHGSDTCSSDNAHEDSGMNDEKDADNDEADEDGTPPPGSPGPAVYIIHKLPPKPPKARRYEEDQEEMKAEKEETEKVKGSGKKTEEEAGIDTIPLKFFTY